MISSYLYYFTVKSPLVLNLNSAPVSTYFRRWKYGTNFTLNARDYSYDPDDENDDKDGKVLTEHINTIISTVVF